MMLLLDIGNTSVKWAVQENNMMSPAGRFNYRGADFSVLARAAWGHLPVPKKIVASNVAGTALANTLAEWTVDHWNISPKFARVKDKAFGVTNAYAQPVNLGVDRWAAMIGAFSSAGEALCIVDCGTAVTLDFLAADGVHQGGMILPGIDMLQQSLLDNTADITLSGDAQFTSPLASDTGEAVNNGAIYMVTATIDRVITDMGLRVGVQPSVIITGGDAGRIQSLLACPGHHDPDLVLKGLAILAGEL